MLLKIVKKGQYCEWTDIELNVKEAIILPI